MDVQRLILGDLETNCYILTKNSKCIIIDPAGEAEKIKEAVGQNKVLTILITHHHFDHIGAKEELIEYYKVKENNFDIIDDMEVISTPGHSLDSITFYFKKEQVMFCGDFLFKNTFGRVDLEGGDAKMMIESINKIKMYDDNIKLFPGHGEFTYLGKEKQNFKDYLAYLQNLEP